MNVLYGLMRADEGQILLDGQPAQFHSPKSALAAGIGMVHQHFMPAPVFTVAENVTLRIERTKVLGLLDRRGTLLAWIIGTSAMHRPGRTDLVRPFIAGDAQLPRLLGSSLRIKPGFLVALAVAAAVCWLLTRGTTGFGFRTVGANPGAARTAGMSVNRSWILVMVIAGGLAGLAASTVILGTDYVLNFQSYGTYGTDAITVALLRRSRPLGTVLAALLFGADRALVPYENTLNSPATFNAIKIPGLGDIPIIGPTFFDSTIFLYITYVTIRHPGPSQPLPQRHPGRPDRRHRRGVPGDRIGGCVRQRHLGGKELHRPGRHGLRPVDATGRRGCRADLRFHGRVAEHPVNAQRANPTQHPADGPVRGHNRRRRRPGRAREATQGRWQALGQAVTRLAAAVEYHDPERLRGVDFRPVRC
jgi:ABC-type sugar transport system ATPase subunit